MILCGTCGGVMEEEYTTIKRIVGDKILLIRHVPCYRCKQCGEIEYDYRVAKTIQKIVKRYKTISKNTEIAYIAA